MRPCASTLSMIMSILRFILLFTFALSSFFCVSAHRGDSNLWLPKADSGLSVEYKGKNQNAIKASEILAKHSPDDYFKTIKLEEKKVPYYKHV